MPGSLSHLARRFFDVLSSKPLSVDEQAAVEAWLEPDLGSVFMDQQHADQRHGYNAALSVIASGHDDPDIVVAALIHDVGKRYSRLGVVGRSVASILILSGLPLTRRMTDYRDHGFLAARELAALGAPPLAVDFAMHHHGDRPATIDADVWETLQAADEPAKAGAGR